LLELVNDGAGARPGTDFRFAIAGASTWWQRDTEKLRAALERLTEAAEAAGQADDERYALTQLVRLVPDDVRYASASRELGGAQEEEPVDEPMAFPDASVREVPTFESFAIVGEDDEFAAVRRFMNRQSGRRI